MIARKSILSALVLTTALAGGAAGLSAFSTEQAAAQAANTAPQAQMREHHEHRFDPSRHLEGRIAYLKAELKITDAQAPQFDRVAQAMRDNAKETAAAFGQRRGDRDQPQSAVDRLETRAKFEAMRAEHAQRFLAAFKPLYASLSDDQKKSADGLLAGHHHGHRR